MKVTQTQILAAWDGALTDMAADWGFNPQNAFMSLVDLRSTDSGGTVSVAYYPDYDDNTALPIKFESSELLVPHGSGMWITYDEMIGLVPVFAERLVSWFSSVYEAQVVDFLMERAGSVYKNGQEWYGHSWNAPTNITEANHRSAVLSRIRRRFNLYQDREVRAGSRWNIH